MSATPSDKCGKNKSINNLRPFEKIPIFVVEDHNDVLEFIYRCLGARRIPFTSNKIIHFDSHPDMTIPKYMPAEYVKQRDKLLNTLSIENWLMPTAYAGHINQLIWIKPEWSNQMNDGDYAFNIGEYGGYIRCDSSLEYFLSEGTYQPSYKLNQSRLINLSVFTLNEILINGQQHFGAQNRRIEFQNCVDNANEQFILDIDLDFFSTANPFKKILSNSIYDDLKKLFKGNFFDKTFDSNSSDDELIAFTKQRSEFIDALEMVFRQLDQSVDENELTMPDALMPQKTQVLDLIRNVKTNSTAEIAWMTIFDAGCTFDSNDLPHHISTEDEIRQLIAQFKRFLEAILYVPCIITVSRSSDDDYCPIEHVDLIQQLVLDAIYAVYGDRVNSKPIFYYKDDEWTV